MSDVARVINLRNATYDESYKSEMSDVARVDLKMPDVTRVYYFENVRYSEGYKFKKCQT